MTTQQAATWIGIARLTGAELFESDQSGELTEAQAAASAERYMDLAVARIEALYPAADVEVIQGNGIDSIRVTDDHGNEDEVMQEVHWSLEALSESASYWVLDN